MSKTIPVYYSPQEKIGVEDNIEVRNTIIRCFQSISGAGSLYSIDALTDNDWLRLLAVRCDTDQREWLTSLLATGKQRWETPKSSFFIGFTLQDAGRTPASAPLIAGAPRPEPGPAAQHMEWINSPDELLNALESDTTAAEDRITAILFAEITPFDESQKPRLLRELYQFIDVHRFCTDDELATAVGSAIRKFAMNMPSSEFEHYARLFLPTATDTLSPDIELELAKAASWRLAKAAALRTGDYPGLEARLTELASDYLTPRLILQKNYASIVSHAVVGLGLLAGERQDELVERARELGIDWFRDALAARLLEMANKRREHCSDSADRLLRLRTRLVTVHS